MATKKQSKIDAYRKSFYSTINRLKTRKAGFTVDDVVAKVGNPPQGRVALGGLMNGAALSNELSVKGYVPSRTTSRKDALVAVWSK